MNVYAEGGPVAKEAREQTNVERLVEAGVLDPDRLTREQGDAINELNLHEVETLIYVAGTVGTAELGMVTAWLI